MQFLFIKVGYVQSRGGSVYARYTANNKITIKPIDRIFSFLIIKLLLAVNGMKKYILPTISNILFLAV